MHHNGILVALQQYEQICNGSSLILLEIQQVLHIAVFFHQTPDFDYAGLVVVAVFKISSKYVGITRSLATRRTRGVPKLLHTKTPTPTERLQHLLMI